MRVLIDYRPALRNPTGVGEYCRGLVRGLLELGALDRADGLDLTVFSSSWKDRGSPRVDLAGADIVDRRVPVSVLNFAWHRLGWPAVEVRIGETSCMVRPMTGVPSTSILLVSGGTRREIPGGGGACGSARLRALWTNRS